jgi:hypothetical protein
MNGTQLVKVKSSPLELNERNKMANGRPITNDRLYDTLNSMRLELKSDIGDLRRQFETLEAGRLTRLEGKMSDMEISQMRRDNIIKTNQAVISTKFLVLATVGVAIFNSILYYFFSRVLK